MAQSVPAPKEDFAVLKFVTLAAAMLALAPLGPLGCPPIEDPNDTELPERGTLAVTATAPSAATIGETVSLQATLNSSAQGAVQYAWLQSAGAGVRIANPDQASASFTAPSLPARQTLRFMVTATDEAGAVGRAEVAIAVAADPNYGTDTSPPARPVADAGNDQKTVPGTLITLDGSASTGINLRYAWRQVSGTSVTLNAADTAQATFTAPAYDPDSTNILLFELAVTDANGHQVTDRAQVTVRDPSLSDRKVRIATSLGNIDLELNPEKAPITVDNFLQYVDDKFYDGTIFHRVIEGFVIQGGGFEPGLVQKATRAAIVNEADNGLSNVRGTIAMARLSAPDTATSQFFINHKDNIAGGDGQSDLDPGGVSEDGYAVFGEVIAGLDVVDAIAAVETESRSGFSDVPVEDVLINSIRRLPAD